MFGNFELICIVVGATIQFFLLAIQLELIGKTRATK